MAALPASLKGWLEAPALSPEQQREWFAGVGAGRPQAPSAAAAATAPGTSGFKLMGSLEAGMMGLGPSLHNGPDLYDPQGPNGPEPVPQTSGAEKCYRLLNSWLYKCAVAPM